MSQRFRTLKILVYTYTSSIRKWWHGFDNRSCGYALLRHRLDFDTDYDTYREVRIFL